MCEKEALKLIEIAYSIDLAQNDFYEALKPIVDYANENNIKIKIELTGVF